MIEPMPGRALMKPVTTRRSDGMMLMSLRTRNMRSDRSTEKGPVAGMQRDRHHHKVEDAPGITEKGGPIDDGAGQQFDNENTENRAIDHRQQRAERRHRRRRCLEPERDRVDDDQRCDDKVEAT